MKEPFGKFFAKTFTGSMRGAGSHVIAVMAYAVAHAKPPEGQVEMNPEILAFLIGDTQKRIEEALKYLMAPDPKSRTKKEQGKRLIKEGEYLYRLVNWADYRNCEDDEARKMYFREKKREYRAGAKKSETKADTHSIPYAEPTDTLKVGKPEAKEKAFKNPAIESAEVELPPRFPKTLKEALEVAQLAGCPPDVAEKAWKKANSRGGRDAKDVPIRNFRAYLGSEAMYARSRETEKRPRYEQPAGSVPLRAVHWVKGDDGLWYEEEFVGDEKNVVSRKLCDPQPKEGV